MLKALIVDDEIASVRTLELLLSQFARDVEVVDVARSSVEALSKVDLIRPDIVFLDIEMPGGNGFDFLENCAYRDFDVIFITAFEYYAVKAFKFSAIDYLLKPIEVEELQAALARVAKRRSSNFDGRKRYYALFENLKTILPSKLVVAVGNRSEFIDLKSVAYFEQNQKGASVVYADGSKLGIDNSLVSLEEVLDSKNFARANSVQLVSLEQIKRIGRSGTVDLRCNISITASPEFLSSLMEQLEMYINQKQ